MNYRLVVTLIVITNLFSHIDHEVPSCDRQRARCRKTWKLTFFAEKWLFTRFCHRSQTVGITKLVGCQANTRDYSKVISLSPQSKNACFGIHFQNPLQRYSFFLNCTNKFINFIYYHTLSANAHIRPSFLLPQVFIS